MKKKPSRGKKSCDSRTKNAQGAKNRRKGPEKRRSTRTTEKQKSEPLHKRGGRSRTRGPRVGGPEACSLKHQLGPPCGGTVSAPARAGKTAAGPEGGRARREGAPPGTYAAASSGGFRLADGRPR